MLPRSFGALNLRQHTCAIGMMQTAVTKSKQMLDISALSDGIYTVVAGEERLRLVVAK